MKLQRLLVISFLLLGSSAAMAATGDTITMGGSVASTLQVACTDTAGAGTLDFDGGLAVTVVKVSDCNASSNDDAGLTVTFNPDANFTSVGADVFAFAILSLADAATVPVEADFVGLDGLDDIWATAVSGSTDADVYVRFTQDVAADPGTYAANIEVSVADNS